MKIDFSRGILSDAQFIRSPNFNERPLGENINLLVIHNISLPAGNFETRAVIDFFCNRLDFHSHPSFHELANLKVSAHLFIRRNGEIIQFVPFHQRAWHAGVSHFEGRSDCNNFSIGIELEGTDNMAYNNTQYQRLAKISQSLMRVYPGITPKRIVGHCDIAPDRKSDPGPAFDWSYYRGLLVKE